MKLGEREKWGCEFAAAVLNTLQEKNMNKNKKGGSMGLTFTAPWLSSYKHGRQLILQSPSVSAIHCSHIAEGNNIIIDK